MVKGKRPAGKGAVRKAVGKPKPRKRAARKSAAKPGIGHNKPPREPVPHTAPPNISNWHIAETGAQIARQTAEHRQRAFRATTSSEPVAPSLALTSDPRQHGSAKFEGAGTLAADPIVVHAEMRKRIAALEETIAKLPTAPGGPLNDNEIDETKSELATLKTLPPVPAKPPTEAAGAQSKLAKFGEMVLQRLAADEAGRAIAAASKALWAQYGDQLIALARSIGEWIASLPQPP
jgi:hypothetical protein